MKNKWVQIGFPVLLFAALVAGYSLKKPEQLTVVQAPASYAFDYYPKANVYFSHADRTYSYPDGQGNWRTASHFTDTAKLHSDQKISLSSPAKEIWKRNEEHRLIYGVQLYSSPEDFRQEPKLAPPTTAPKGDEVAEQKEPEKKEKGLKKFFNKLFKKDNNKAS